MSPVTTHVLDLPDGRTLQVYASGPDDGEVLVFHHGTPAAAVRSRGVEASVHRRGLRLVMLSRPGYGDSTRLPHRRIVDVVDDTAEVLRWLGVEQCLVAGWSGGGPHALACAARLPAARAALVIAGIAPAGQPDLDWTAGMGQDNVDETAASYAGPDELRAFLEGQAESLRTVSPDDIIAGMSSLLPEVDRDALTGEFAEDLADSFHEALRTGVDGWLDDDMAFIAPWGFEFTEITVPTFLWQGSEDLMVPFAHGQWFARHLPQATVHLEEGEGHVSLAAGAIDRMLDELLAAAG